MKHLLKLSLVPLALAGCAKLETKSDVNVAPIKVEPIHITMDINIKVKVDKELDSFFAFEDQFAKPTTQPATQPVNQ